MRSGHGSIAPGATVGGPTAGWVAYTPTITWTGYTITNPGGLYLKNGPLLLIEVQFTVTVLAGAATLSVSMPTGTWVIPTTPTSGFVTGHLNTSLSATVPGIILSSFSQSTGAALITPQQTSATGGTTGIFTASFSVPLAA